MHVIQKQLDASLVQIGDTRVAHGRQNAPQIRVTRKKRCFDQRRMGDGIGHLAALGGRFTAVDLHGDEFGSAFAVADDGLGELASHLQHRRKQGLAVGTGQRIHRCVARLVGGDHDE